jgi:hypothetical protein
LAGSTGFGAAGAAAFRAHRQSPLADLTGLSRIEGELGLDHYEGRQWLGWHHHVCLVTMAYAFLRFEQAHLKKNFWCDLEPVSWFSRKWSASDFS